MAHLGIYIGDGAARIMQYKLDSGLDHWETFQQAGSEASPQAHIEPVSMLYLLIQYLSRDIHMLKKEWDLRLSGVRGILLSKARQHSSSLEFVASFLRLRLRIYQCLKCC